VSCGGQQQFGGAVEHLCEPRGREAFALATVTAEGTLVVKRKALRQVATRKAGQTAAYRRRKYIGNLQDVQFLPALGICMFL